jgi:eukaryotic-like serine/threonine-protein kinase
VDLMPTAEPARSDNARSRTKVWLPALVLATAGAIAGVAIGRWLPRSEPIASPVQFNLSPPPSNSFATPPGGGTGIAPQLAISPNGRQIAFVASGPNAYQLWIRSLDSMSARALAGTDDAAFPFWSPDGRYIGFFAQGSLKKVAVEGGGPVVLCDAIAGRGGSWNKDNVIVFTPSTTGPLQRVSAAGGVPTAASVLDPKVGDTNHRFPVFLPDGRHFLFSSVYGTCCPAVRPGHLKIGSLDTMEVGELLQVESAAAYGAGHVLFNRGGVLMAQRLDAATRALTGEPFTIADHVASEGSRYASVSATDTNLIYVGGTGSSLSRLDWVDRSGNLLGTAAEDAAWLGPNLSPDGRRIAVAVLTGTPPNRDIWILDTVGKTRSHVTFDPGDDNAPVWSPDQKYVAYQGNRGGFSHLLTKEVSGGKNEEVLAQREDLQPGALIPTDWSSDGRYLLFNRSQGVEGSTDVWMLPLFGDRKPLPLIQTKANETGAIFSPDAHWMAYVSNESGAPQIYVQPFPLTGAKYHISQGGAGAIQPLWSKDGREILYVELDASGPRLTSVPVRTNPDFQAGASSPLFRFSLITTFGGSSARGYSMTNDGKRFLVATLQQQVTTPMTVMLNWLSARR